jgi:hypothetical protein
MWPGGKPGTAAGDGTTSGRLTHQLAEIRRGSVVGSQGVSTLSGTAVHRAAGPLYLPYRLLFGGLATVSICG